MNTFAEMCTFMKNNVHMFANSSPSKSVYILSCLMQGSRPSSSSSSSSYRVHGWEGGEEGGEEGGRKEGGDKEHGGGKEGGREHEGGKEGGREQGEGREHGGGKEGGGEEFNGSTAQFVPQPTQQIGSQVYVSHLTPITNATKKRSRQEDGTVPEVSKLSKSGGFFSPLDVPVQWCGK